MSVCLSLCRKSEFYRNGWTDRTEVFLAHSFYSTFPFKCAILRNWRNAWVIIATLRVLCNFVRIGADFHSAMVATAPGEKLLICRRPRRNWTRRTISSLFFFTENYICFCENQQKLLPPELHFLTPICTKSFVGCGFAPDPTGGDYSRGGHTGGASGAVHQGSRPLGAHQIAIFFEKLLSFVSHVASHSGYCREIVF